MAARIFRQWPEPVGSEPGVTQIHGRKAAIKFQRLRSGPWPIRASGHDLPLAIFLQTCRWAYAVTRKPPFGRIRSVPWVGVQ